MNWKALWNFMAVSNTDPVKQVGRISANCDLLPHLAFKATVENVASRLSLLPTDQLLDICCGNGLLTKELAKYCSTVTGIDFSPAMVNLARKNNARPNITYIEGDAKAIALFPESTFDKICLNFSFQYFEDYDTGKQVISELLQLLKPGGLLLLGEIPDHKKKWVFYRTWASRAFLFYHTLKGKNLMGKFWKKQELDAICKEFQVKGTYLTPPAGLPYAYYRFDYLIQKPLN